jgi:hypothetical protein
MTTAPPRIGSYATTQPSWPAGSKAWSARPRRRRSRSKYRLRCQMGTRPGSRRVRTSGDQSGGSAWRLSQGRTARRLVPEQGPGSAGRGRAPQAGAARWPGGDVGCGTGSPGWAIVGVRAVASAAVDARGGRGPGRGRRAAGRRERVVEERIGTAWQVPEAEEAGRRGERHVGGRHERGAAGRLSFPLHAARFARLLRRSASRRSAAGSHGHDARDPVHGLRVLCGNPEAGAAPTGGRMRLRTKLLDGRLQTNSRRRAARALSC